MFVMVPTAARSQRQSRTINHDTARVFPMIVGSNYVAMRGWMGLHTY